jgi:hypothetical protein
MMRFDFWNNPIVVSAFRLKYRRGSPQIVTCLYVLALVGLGMLLYHFQGPRIPWARLYLVCILGIQFIISSIYALIATNASIKSEVVNRTLDFQRITTLSPRQILLGKLLGEPSGGYLLGVSTIPLAMVAAMLGAASFAVVALLYLTLVTTGLMFGALGLVQPLEPPSTKSGSGNRAGGGEIGLLVLPLMFLPVLIGNAARLAQNPLGALAVGGLTPVLSLQGLAVGDPWQHQAVFWGVPIPYLVVTPWVQLAVAGLAFHMMSRKMKNPLDPPLTKRQAYIVLLVADVIVAGALYDTSGFVGGLVAQTALFCVANLVLGALLIERITPQRDGLLSWIWRFRGRTGPIRDSWLGDRSENSAAVVTIALVGAVLLLLLVWAPALASAAATPSETEDAATALVLTVLLTLSLGIAYQWFLLVGGRHGKMAFVLAAGLLVVLPAILGGLLGDEIMSFSPIIHYGDWVTRSPKHLSPVPLIGTYGLLLLVSWFGLRRRMRQHLLVVQQKREAMGVL